VAVVTLKQAMDRLRMDEGVPTGDLERTIAAAEAFVAAAIGRKLDPNRPLDVEAVLMLATAWYTAPDGSSEMQGAAIRAFTAVIKQLKYAAPEEAT